MPEPVSNTFHQCAAWADILLDLLYPPLCRSCGERLEKHDGRNICPACWSRIQPVPEPSCTVCGAPAETPLPEGRPCILCPEGEIYFDRAAAVALYSGVMRDCIHWFKFRFKRNLHKSLGALLQAGFQEKYPAEQFDAVIPVPLHWTRQRQREFNQAKLLAQALAAQHSLPLMDKLLIRGRRTRPQSRLGRAVHRRKNIQGAFKVIKPEEVKNRSLLLIDDLYTSGNTVNECARVLKKAGANRVCVLTLARA